MQRKAKSTLTNYSLNAVLFVNAVSSVMMQRKNEAPQNNKA